MMGIAIWLVPSEPESALLQQLMSRHPNPSAQHSFPHFHPHVTLATIRRPPPAGPPDEREEGRSESSRYGYGHDHNNVESELESSSSDSMTLLALALRESIPLGQRALRIRFARVLTGDTYFLSIYIALAPSDELAQLRSSALTAVRAQVRVRAGAGGDGPNRGSESGGGGGGGSPAFPHLSLFYIADEEAHARVRLLQEMEREGVVRHSDDGLSVALRCAPTPSQAEAGEDSDDGGGVLLEGFTATQIWIVDCEGQVEGWKVLDKILLATSDR